MLEVSALVVLVVIFALAFDYINGFHDTANAIATVVSTRVLSPRNAIIMAAVLNFGGAVIHTGVAKTVSSGLVDNTGVSQTVILAGLIGAIFWNLFTWYYGIPSSSSHALIGGICGAALAHAGGSVIIWYQEPKPGDWQPGGLLFKVIIPIFASPIGAFIVGFTVMTLIYMICARMHPGRIGRAFRYMQIMSSAAMAGMHGSNDAQKSMGIITMALAAFEISKYRARYGQDVEIPHSLQHPEVQTWVMLSCAIAMALGTAAGGWRIIKTMGHKIIKLEPVHGFAAETSASIIILIADLFKAPISTTHTISGSIFGVGAAKRLSAVRWTVAEQMIVAWLLTLPASGIVAALSYYLLEGLGVR
jgi:PiT family inorganic phosphate transporter